MEKKAKKDEKKQLKTGAKSPRASKSPLQVLIPGTGDRTSGFFAATSPSVERAKNQPVTPTSPNSGTPSTPTTPSTPSTPSSNRPGSEDILSGGSHNSSYGFLRGTPTRQPSTQPPLPTPTTPTPTTVSPQQPPSPTVPSISVPPGGAPTRELSVRLSPRNGLPPIERSLDSDLSASLSTDSDTKMRKPENPEKPETAENPVEPVVTEEEQRIQDMQVMRQKGFSFSVSVDTMVMSEDQLKLVSLVKTLRDNFEAVQQLFSEKELIESITEQLKAIIARVKQAKPLLSDAQMANDLEYYAKSLIIFTKEVHAARVAEEGEEEVISKVDKTVMESKLLLAKIVQEEKEKMLVQGTRAKKSPVASAPTPAATTAATTTPSPTATATATAAATTAAAKPKAPAPEPVYTSLSPPAVPTNDQQRTSLLGRLQTQVYNILEKTLSYRDTITLAPDVEKHITLQHVLCMISIFATTDFTFFLLQLNKIKQDLVLSNCLKRASKFLIAYTFGEVWYILLSIRDRATELSDASLAAVVYILDLIFINVIIENIPKLKTLPEVPLQLLNFASPLVPNLDNVAKPVFYSSSVEIKRKAVTATWEPYFVIVLADNIILWKRDESKGKKRQYGFDQLAKVEWLRKKQITGRQYSVNVKVKNELQAKLGESFFMVFQNESLLCRFLMTVHSLGIPSGSQGLISDVDEYVRYFYSLNPKILI